MARYQVILAYDGSDFYGFQRQANNTRAHSQGRRTVQGVFESSLQRLGWQAHSILSAGRTDTGVHASGQVVTFDLDWGHSVDALRAALNANLPNDVAVQEVMQVKPDFHPRYAALARLYRYRIICQPVRDPLRERYAWRVWPAADLERLQQAATYLPGVHDFAAFGTPPRTGGTTVRNIFRADWLAEEDGLAFEILGNAFLYRMVRRLVNFQVEIGQGIRKVDDLCKYLDSGPQALVQGLAPSQGLTLVAVVYPRETTEPDE